MNREQLRAILWLRWKLIRRGLERGSPLGAVLAGLVGLVAVGSGLASFALALFLGTRLLPRAQPEHVLFVWGLCVVAFLFLWATGVLAELQRSEPLSLTKLLHLPVPPLGAFLLNYLSSFLSVSLATVVPLLVALVLQTSDALAS